MDRYTVEERGGKRSDEEKNRLLLERMRLLRLAIAGFRSKRRGRKSR